ncbi:transketolase C-terminal domain-containing protein, partial [Bacillus paralicheniformis]
GLPILTIEEAVLQGGFGSSILEYAHEHQSYSPIIDRMGIPDQFIEHGSVAKLLEEIGMTKEDVIRRIRLLTPVKTHKGIGS